MKVIAGVVCAALLIVALAFSPSFSADVKAGAGKEENAEFTSLEDVADFFEFLKGGSGKTISVPGFDFLSAETEYDTDDNTELPTGIESEISSEKPEPSGSKKPREKKTYTSGTIHEVSQVNSSSSYSDDSYSRNSHYSMVRTLSVYIAEDASYYKSNGSLQSSSEYWYSDGDDDSNSTSMMWDFEFYFDEDTMLMKINNLVFCSDVDDFEFPIDRDAFGKWLDISETAGLGEIYLDTISIESLSELGECINKYMDKDFVKNGKVYTLINKFMEDSKVVVNLNDADRPVLEMTYSDSDSDDNMGASYSYSNYVGATYTFENVNNTVVKLSDDIKIEDAADYIDLED